VRKNKPQSLNQRPLSQPEKPQRLQWKSKPKRFLNSQLKPLRLKMEPQRKPKSQNLQNNPVKKKPQRRLLRPSPQSKRLSFQRRKSKNQANKKVKKKSQRRLFQPKLPPSQSPKRSKNHLKKVKKKSSQQRRLPSHPFKRSNPQLLSQLPRVKRSKNLQRKANLKKKLSQSRRLPNLQSKRLLSQRRKFKNQANNKVNKKSQSSSLKSKPKWFKNPNKNNNKSQPRSSQPERLQRIKSPLLRKLNNPFKTLKTMKKESSKLVSKDFHSTLMILTSELCSNHAEKSFTSTYS